MARWPDLTSVARWPTEPKQSWHNGPKIYVMMARWPILLQWLDGPQIYVDGLQKKTKQSWRDGPKIYATMP